MNVNYNNYFLVRIRFIESATGRFKWLMLFDQCLTGLLDVTAKYFSVMNETVHTYKLNTLVGTRVSWDHH
ncbi:hypothetical protein NP493_961g00014 [Ridgeia piscesae]|uniref:Uncharacterized protein n=1 Tax=Ridgeia piscesae TaxID=27915 RepID=A0AAD9KJP6_RIDPI|nr:hypothetical protein NP493_961g00014 [Ridgeia piscesae]